LGDEHSGVFIADIGALSDKQTKSLKEAKNTSLPKFDHALHYESNRDKISTMVELVMRSVRIKTLIIKEPFRDYKIRPEIHFLLIAESGSGKSALLSDISNSWHGVRKPPVWSSLTNAGLVGTLSKNGEMIPGAAHECDGGLFLIDEFVISNDFEQSSNMNGILQIAESGKFTKAIGYAAKPDSKHGRVAGSYFRVKSGMVELNVKVGMIFTTMRRLERSKNPAIDAFASRCVPFFWNITQQEIDEMMMGKMLIRKIESEFVKKGLIDVVIPQEDYLRIFEYVRGQGLNKNLFARCVTDCCRVFAAKGNEHEEGLYKLVCDLKKSFENARIDYFRQEGIKGAETRWKGDSHETRFGR